MPDAKALRSRAVLRIQIDGVRDDADAGGGHAETLELCPLGFADRENGRRMTIPEKSPGRTWTNWPAREPFARAGA